MVNSLSLSLSRLYPQNQDWRTKKPSVHLRGELEGAAKGDWRRTHRIFHRIIHDCLGPQQLEIPLQRSADARHITLRTLGVDIASIPICHHNYWGCAST
jgi:hypothetical protein